MTCSPGASTVLSLLSLLLQCSSWTHSVGALDFVYHNHTEVEAFLGNLAATFPKLTHLYSIGRSVEGRKLWVLAIGARPCDHVPLRPDVKYVGNMHGNEITNRELLLHLAEHLVTNYGKNQTVTSLLDRTRIHVLPSMNPDGAHLASVSNEIGNFRLWNGTNNALLHSHMCESIYGRANKNNFDLNRNFLDYFVGNNISRQPETLAVMEWLCQYQFVLSANLHGGALVANYPLDNYAGAAANNGKAQNSTSPDDDVFRHLSTTYSYSHPTMCSGVGCPNNRFPSSFPDGIVNGAQWYPVTGGMQDYNYIYSGCMEVTLELHCCKYAPSWYIRVAWEENREAFINYLLQAHIGIKGRVTDTNQLKISGAEMTIRGREFFVVRTTSNGEFWRLLLPGNYTLQVQARGYVSQALSVRVRPGLAAEVHVVLTRRQPDIPQKATVSCPPTGSGPTRNNAAASYAGDTLLTALWFVYMLSHLL